MPKDEWAKAKRKRVLASELKDRLERANKATELNDRISRFFSADKYTGKDEDLFTVDSRLDGSMILFFHCGCIWIFHKDTGFSTWEYKTKDCKIKKRTVKHVASMADHAHDYNFRVNEDEINQALAVRDYRTNGSNRGLGPKGSPNHF